MGRFMISFRYERNRRRARVGLAGTSDNMPSLPGLARSLPTASQNRWRRTRVSMTEPLASSRLPIVEVALAGLNSQISDLGSYGN